MNFKRYHVSRNLCPITSFDKTTDVYYTILFNMPIPTGTYTLSAKITSTLAESRISFRKADMSQISASNIVIQTGRSQLTVTLNEPCYAIYIYGGTTVFDNIPIKYENIMLNSGGTALPYEPYSSEVWHDITHYIHNTATDTITTLPAVVYVNDTTATVGLKGQTVQSSIPSPTSPVMPQGTGDLETSGAKAGQYKIPILSNSTTTNVCLGEVETMRKIKKLVLDGTEAFYASGSWGKTNTAVYYTTAPNAMNLSIKVAYVMCSHYVGASRNYIYDNDIECSGMTGSNSLTFRVSRQYAGTKEDFLAYLAAQYANGTPVTVWYVLANEETAVVNEPLMKIGDYADEVSGITIPTIAGANTLSIGTTVQPSEVTVNYKGWHPVADVHERENGAWT